MNIREGDQRAHINQILSQGVPPESCCYLMSTPDETKPWFITWGGTPQIVISSDT